MNKIKKINLLRINAIVVDAIKRAWKCLAFSV